MYDPYIFLIGISLLVAMSYIFNLASKNFKIPSVLFLIFTGIILKYIMDQYHINLGDELNNSLQTLGIIGLIMIVLEAAIDLELARDKLKIIWKSLYLSVILLFLSAVSIALIISTYLNEPFINGIIYAIPLSVVSSAILIPSVHSLTKSKKEFLIYESTFSDIIGIMFFNFVVLSENTGGFSASIFIEIAATILASVILSYILVFFFTKIKTQVKIFLMLSILTLLYAVGKQFHISSLLIILVFGLVLNNHHIFFKGFMSKMLTKESVDFLAIDFRVITAETAFLIRTFFFVAFGMSINLAVLLDINVIVIGTLIVLVLYSMRYLNFKVFLKTNVYPEIFLSPRGLVTILLFYSIPAHYLIKDFSIGILFFVILTTGIIMMIALMATPKEKSGEMEPVAKGFIPTDYIHPLERGSDEQENEDVMSKPDRINDSMENNINEK